MYQIAVGREDECTEFNCLGGDTILDGALKAGLRFPYECGVGACGSCKLELISGTLEMAQETYSGLSERDRKRNRFLGCQAKARSDCRIGVRIPREGTSVEPPVRRRLRLRSAVDLTDDLRHFFFSSDAPAEFRPGQYALISIPGTTRRRAYSMANVANREGTWEFIIKRVPQGEASRYLFDTLAVGDWIDADIPYGHAHLNEQSTSDILCVSGGSGISPMLSIARANALRATPQRLHFYYGGRTTADLCAKALLKEYVGDSSLDRCIQSASHSADIASAGEGIRTGFIHQVLADDLGTNIRDFDLYMAGPPQMLDAVLQYAVISCGHNPERVRFDRIY